MSEQQPRSPLSPASDVLAASFLNATRVYFQAWENLAELNFGTLRQLLDDEAAGCKHLWDSTDLKQAAAVQTSLARVLLERNTAYARAAWELGNATAGELNPLLRSQYAEWQAAAEDGARRIAEAAPFGKELALGVVRQAGSFSQALQQAAAALPGAPGKTGKARK